jgi:hypothetical protein
MLHARLPRGVAKAATGPLTARRKDGASELRYAIRLVRGHGAVDRRMVQDCCRDVAQQSAQVGCCRHRRPPGRCAPEALPGVLVLVGVVTGWRRSSRRGPVSG